MVAAGAGHAAGAQFVDHRHLAERGVFEKVTPQVHELADHLRVDEGHMGARGLLDLVHAGVRP